MQDADSLGILDASKLAASADVDVYAQALKRVEQEVAKVPHASDIEETKGEKPATEDDGEDFDKMGDDLMSKMMAEAEESNYVVEYNEVIAEVSKICRTIMAN